MDGCNMVNWIVEQSIQRNVNFERIFFSFTDQSVLEAHLQIYTSLQSFFKHESIATGFL